MNFSQHYKNVGKVFGRLTIVSVYKGNTHFIYRYVCECGNISEAQSNKILTGHTKSCGCLHIEKLKEVSITHGMYGSSEYRSYFNARCRCNKVDDIMYESYGGRGIMFLFNSFEEFYKELGPKPSPFHQIDRINNDGNYEPGNVRWVTRKENCNNRRNSLIKI